MCCCRNILLGGLTRAYGADVGISFTYGGRAMVDERMRAIDDAVRQAHPDWPAFDDRTLETIAASADRAPEMSDRQRRRVGRLLFGAEQKAS